MCPRVSQPLPAPLPAALTFSSSELRSPRTRAACGADVREEWEGKARRGAREEGGEGGAGGASKGAAEAGKILVGMDGVRGNDEEAHAKGASAQGGGDGQADACRLASTRRTSSRAAGLMVLAVRCCCWWCWRCGGRSYEERKPAGAIRQVEFDGCDSTRKKDPMVSYVRPKPLLPLRAATGVRQGRRKLAALLSSRYCRRADDG